VLRRLGIIDAAQRVGFTLEEIRDLLASRDQPAHERLRQLAVLKLPEDLSCVEACPGFGGSPRAKRRCMARAKL
jgi:DNA-binding transcriptional MerR regulator